MSKSYAKTRGEEKDSLYHERKIVEKIGSDKNNLEIFNSSITLEPLTAIVRKRWNLTPTHMLSNQSITFYVAASSSLAIFYTANSFICLRLYKFPCWFTFSIIAFFLHLSPLYVFCCSLRLHKKWLEEISTRFTYQLKVSEEDSIKYSYFFASYTHAFSHSQNMSQK